MWILRVKGVKYIEGTRVSGPPTPFPVRNGYRYLLSVFLLPMELCIARLHSLAGKGAGGPKSYDSKQCCGSMTFWGGSMPLTNGSGSGSCYFRQ